MFTKLQGGYKKWVLLLNINKTEYMRAGSNNRDGLDIINSRHFDVFRYLGVTFSTTGKSDHDVNKIMSRYTGQINSVL